jgi:hypothetical protein
MPGAGKTYLAVKIASIRGSAGIQRSDGAVGAYNINPTHVRIPLRKLSRLEASDSILSAVTSMRRKIGRGLALVRQETKVFARDNVKCCKFEELSDAL